MRDRERPTLGSIFTPPVFADEVRSDTAWMLHWLVWSIAGVITAMILLLIPILDVDPARFAGQALAVDLLCLGMILLLRRGFLKLASRLLVVGMWLIALATVWTSNGLESPAVATFLLAVAYMIIFLGRKTGFVSVALVAATVAGLVALHGLGLVPEPSVVHTPASRALTVTLYSVILAAALALQAMTLQRSRSRTERELADRRIAEAEVRDLNADLENRVEERTATLEGLVDDLELSNQRLASATRAKSDFLAAMSHELRTPLNSVIGFSGTLASGLAGPLNEEQQRQAEMIGTSGRILLDLVNQVLDLAKIEAGTVEVSLGDVDIPLAVRRVVEVATPLAAEKGLLLTTSADENVGTIRTDPLRVEQALLNLVGNAIKFTQEGSVSIETKVVGLHVVVEVRDTGPGIPADELSHIFERFYQVTPSTGGKHEGTGLGLALTKQSIEDLGGTVEAGSTVGEGSVFRIRLPRTAPTP